MKAVQLQEQVQKDYVQAESADSAKSSSNNEESSEGDCSFIMWSMLSIVIQDVQAVLLENAQAQI